jgi:Fe2+ transport system protein B
VIVLFEDSEGWYVIQKLDRVFGRLYASYIELPPFTDNKKKKIQEIMQRKLKKFVGIYVFWFFFFFFFLLVFDIGGVVGCVNVKIGSSI